MGVSADKMANNFLLFTILMLTYIGSSKEENSTRKITVCGMECLTSCDKDSDGYWMCGQWRWAKSDSSGYDYCSPGPGLTSNGGRCWNECIQRNNTEYFWCNTGHSGWDYCSPAQFLPTRNYNCHWGRISDYYVFIGIGIAIGAFCCYILCVCIWRFSSIYFQKRRSSN